MSALGPEFIQDRGLVRNVITMKMTMMITFIKRTFYTYISIYSTALYNFVQTIGE